MTQIVPGRHARDDTAVYFRGMMVPIHRAVDAIERYKRDRTVDPAKFMISPFYEGMRMHSWDRALRKYVPSPIGKKQTETDVFIQGVWHRYFPELSDDEKAQEMASLAQDLYEIKTRLGGSAVMREEQMRGEENTRRFRARIDQMNQRVAELATIIPDLSQTARAPGQLPDLNRPKINLPINGFISCSTIPQQGLRAALPLFLQQVYRNMSSSYYMYVDSLRELETAVSIVTILNRDIDAAYYRDAQGHRVEIPPLRIPLAVPSQRLVYDASSDDEEEGELHGPYFDKK